VEEEIFGDGSVDWGLGTGDWGLGTGDWGGKGRLWLEVESGVGVVGGVVVEWEWGGSGGGVDSEWRGSGLEVERGVGEDARAGGLDILGAGGGAGGSGVRGADGTGGVLEYWSTGVLEYWSTGVLEGRGGPGGVGSGRAPGAAEAEARR
jgi:hypothetical protein